jgi:hypothetical protein
MRTLLIVLITSTIALAQTTRPLLHHPGNVFVEGEQVTLPPSTQPLRYFDYDNKQLDNVNNVPIGYYEARTPDNKRYTTFAVIAPLKQTASNQSPLAIDVAMAWFYKNPQQQKDVISLLHLANINHVRDRLSWPEMEPQRGKFADHNIYDDTAKLQSESNLRVLQVNHASPPWANPDGRRFPLDLRDAYNFNKAMAARWKGQVEAIEPWNEADIDVFGGHTGSEMASMQKASYLGLKAGNPETIACQNVFAIARQTTLDDFAANEATAYFDTYNLHHYVPFEKYPTIYAQHRAISGGKPMWVTECSVTVNWADEKTKEPDAEALRWQANRVAKVYSMSLHEGSAATFYFILGHYVERTLQYGIIHEDLTPRPAYVALAAAGRYLADAKPMGRWKHEDPTVHGYLFRAKPDGEEKLVLVAWRQAKGDLKVKLNAPVEQMIDHLGRPRQGSWVGEFTLTGAPTYLIVPPALEHNIPVDPPPQAPPLNQDKPTTVVLQAVMPPETIDLQQSAYALAPDQDHELTLRAYNFGEKPITADLTAEFPEAWKLELPKETQVPPAGMNEVKVKLPKRAPSPTINPIKFRWSDALLSIRIADTKSPPKH